MRGDKFSKYLRERKRQLTTAYNRNHKASFTDEDSGSYDRSQRLAGALTEMDAVLNVYLRFKRWK